MKTFQTNDVASPVPRNQLSGHIPIYTNLIRYLYSRDMGDGSHMPCRIGNRPTNLAMSAYQLMVFLYLAQGYLVISHGFKFTGVTYFFCLSFLVFT